MPSNALGGTSPIPVLLHTSDLLSEAGSADEELVTQWCAGAPANGPRAVLVTGRLRQSGLSNLVAGGIGAVAWRHEATGPRLVRAVTAVARGEADMPADLVRALMDQVGGLLPRTPGRPSGSTALTAREMSILRRAADGDETGEIADRFGYSERTISGTCTS